MDKVDTIGQEEELSQIRTLLDYLLYSHETTPDAFTYTLSEYLKDQPDEYKARVQRLIDSLSRVANSSPAYIQEPAPVVCSMERSMNSDSSQSRQTGY